LSAHLKCLLSLKYPFSAGSLQCGWCMCTRGTVTPLARITWNISFTTCKQASSGGREEIGILKIAIAIIIIIIMRWCL
jgi:hypothetical protein